jgi:hypothetical protein
MPIFINSGDDCTGIIGESELEYRFAQSSDRLPQLSAERQAVAQLILRRTSSSNVEGPAFAEEGSHLALCGIGGFSKCH